MKIFSFPPIVNAQSKILILGTMPGKDSLKYNQYYGHSRNAFWKIMFALFDKPYSDDYKIKQDLLLNNNIALWDVLKVCERISSSDTDILEEEPNELTTFLKKYPQINHLIFNGKKSMTFYNKYIKESSLPFTVLPSTSPAHVIPFEKKFTEWYVVNNYLK